MKIFIAFANQDRDVRDKLLRQMNLVKDRQGWNIWSAKELKAGEQWDIEIKKRLFDSEVIILLLSTDFFNSDYIIDRELPEVIAKHQSGNCHIIPVLARLCHWKDTPFGDYAKLGDIQALPIGEKPIMSKGYWDHEDQPYFETVEGIKESIRAFREKREIILAAEREISAREKERADQEERQRQEIVKQQLLLEQQRQEEKRIEAEIIQQEEKRKREQERELHFQELAKKRIIQYQITHDEAWENAQGHHTLEEYNNFISTYPDSPRIREARFRIKELQRIRHPQPIWQRYIILGGLLLIVAILGILFLFNIKKGPHFRVSLQTQSNCNASLVDISKVLRQRVAADTLKIMNLSINEQNKTINFDLKGYPEENDQRNSLYSLEKSLTYSPALEFYKVYAPEDPVVIAFYTGMAGLRTAHQSQPGQSSNPEYLSRDYSGNSIGKTSLVGFDSVSAMFNQLILKQQLPEGCKLVRSAYPEEDKYNVYLLKGQPYLTEQNVFFIEPTFDKDLNENITIGKFDKEGTKIFSQLTKELAEYSEVLAIVIDHQYVLSAPRVIKQIESGDFKISGTDGLKFRLLSPYPCQVKVRNLTVLD